MDIQEKIRKHTLWLNGEPGGERADFQGADLRGADLDFSVWPLWRGSLGSVKVDARIAAQLAYHFCSLDCDDTEYIAARNAILSFANKFHRASECGVLEVSVKKRLL